MQPTLRQVPPRYSRSTQAVFMPNCAARIAATYPPGPAPITTRSKVDSDMFYVSQMIGHRGTESTETMQEKGTGFSLCPLCLCGSLCPGRESKREVCRCQNGCASGQRCVSRS